MHACRSTLEDPTFYGPDADILLETDFQARYCFSLANHDEGRPTQVGLHFSPVKVRFPRVDIDGTLWIDTAARQLRDIEYRYVGLPRGADRRRPGGHVWFRELANGIPFVDSWNIRMVTAIVHIEQALQKGGAPGAWGGAELTQFDAVIGGGVLAQARWPDGARYDAELGSVRIHAMHDDGRPFAGLRIDLDSTFYGGATDSSGTLVIAGLVPGPYSTLIVDTTLDRLGLKLRSPLNFVASNGIVADAALFVREPATALARACGEKSYDGYAVFVARVATPDDKPVEGARWMLGNKNGTTLANGLILPCSKLRVGDTMELLVWRSSGPVNEDRPLSVVFEIKNVVTALRVELPKLPVVKK